MAWRPALLAVLAAAVTIGAASAGPLAYDETPLFGSGSKVDDKFGRAIALSGGTVVVTSPEESFGGGTVYVFARDAGGWTEQQKLTGIGYLYSYSGSSPVAISGDTLVIGTTVSAGGSNLRGSAYVFVRSGAVWTQQQKLNPAGGTLNDEFGSSVAIDGDSIVVGAHGSGTAYVFSRTGTTWSQETALTASDAQSFDDFGGSVGVASGTPDKTVVVGARYHGSAGAAYVFVGSGSTWTQTALAPSGVAADDAFGTAVAVSGDTVVVGAPDADGAGEDAGAAYVFAGSGTSWPQVRRLTASDAEAAFRFGGAVAIDGGTIVVGSAPGFGASTAFGAAYVFQRSGAAWTDHEQARITASDNVARRGFGWCVGVSGDTVAAGKARDDEHGVAGVAFVYAPSSGGGAGPRFPRPLVASADRATAGTRVTFNCPAVPAPAAGKAVPKIAYEWHFGDGATQEAGPKVTHVYATAGTFDAFVRASGPDGKSTDSPAQTIAVFGAGVPFFDIAKVSVLLRFDAADKDRITISGQLPLADGTALLGKVLIIDFGGVVVPFTLDAKGRSPKGASSARLAPPKGGVAKFTVRLAGSLAAALADEGMTNAAVRDVDATTHVAVTFDGTQSAEDHVMVYAARPGRSGAAR